jgi:hypothetical protein
MKFRRISVPAVVAALVWFGSTPLLAQFGPQLGSLPPRGQPVAPYFEGWYENPDGTFTFSFGYFNFNTDESVDVPVGPDNFIEPAELDRGEQPTFFGHQSRRERGVFTVTVPAEYRDQRRVVWTIRANGQSLSVPARVGVDAYQLDHFPRSEGSLAPVLKMAPEAPDLAGPMSVIGHPDSEGNSRLGSFSHPLELHGRVGAPVDLRVWVGDRFEPSLRQPVTVRTAWFKHQGPPGAVQFSRPQAQDDGSVTATATFTRPGEYILRVRADNWAASDSSAGNQCCWTNGYVKVTVTP